MDTTVFVGTLILLQLFCLWAGQRASKKIQNQDDYFLAGKDVRFFPLLMTFVGTSIGGGLVLGASQEAYRFGWTVLLYPLGACLGFIFLALGAGKRLARFPVATISQIFEVVYKSTGLRKMSSLISIVALFVILIAQVIASRKFMVSIGVDNTFLFLIFWGMVVIYTVMGGLKAVVSIDIIQALFFIVFFALGFGYILYTGDFEISKVIAGGWKSDAFDFNAEKLSGWLLIPILVMIVEQDYAQRCFAAKSPRVVTRAAAYAALCTFLVCFIPVFFGVLGKQLGIVVPEGSSVFMDVVTALTNPTITALIGCAVLMAILSTSISLLNAVSSNISQDFDLNFSNEKRKVKISRGITALLGLVAVGGSFFSGQIVDLLIQSYELLVYCLFIPIFAALFKERGNTASAWAAFICGGVGFILTRFVAFEMVPKEAIGLILSFAGYGISEVWIRFRREELAEAN